MYLIFKRKNPYGIVKYNSLDEIKEAVEKEIYGKYKYNTKKGTELKNNYEDFEIIKEPSFPYKLCDDNSGPGIKNIILEVNREKNYYLLDENKYAHGVWNWPSIDGTKIIFDDPKQIKEYCKNIVNETSYMNDSNSVSDNDLIVNKIKNIDKKTKIEFTIGDDYYCSFNISKIV